MKPLQKQIEIKGAEIFSRMEGVRPRAFNPKSVTGRLLGWSMSNPDLKVQLFRLVDVLPALGSSTEVARHTSEYLAGLQHQLPMPLRWALRWAPRVPWAAAWAARAGVRRMAKTFILAHSPAAAIPELRAMRERRLAFTVDLLGETIVSESEADRYQARYLELIDTLADEAAGWKEIPQIDADSRGPLPRVNISVKISALSSQISPADPEGSKDALSVRLAPILARARDRGAFVNLDMESTQLKDLTIDLFLSLLERPEFREGPAAGIALQAYLRQSEHDLDRVIHWARDHKRRITIRLIKGAYWDSETILARQRGWPVPVFSRKLETDANYERLARKMLENAEWIQCAFGTHNVRSIAACLVHADTLGIDPRDVEIQMLYGMAEPIKLALVEMGYRVRDYCPIGEVLPGMSYLVRRLLENTSNESFLRAAFTEKAAPKELLQDPAASLARERTEPSAAKAVPFPSPGGIGGGLSGHSNTGGRPGTEPSRDNHAFRNEPHTDFTVAANRARMAEAIARVRSQLGKKHPLVIAGQEIWTSAEIVSTNPARPSEVIGRVAKAGRAEADAAIEAARVAFRFWRRCSVETRAKTLEKLAELLRRARFELAALEIFETGKNWIESDADVAEAIDFCEYYSKEIRRISLRRIEVPGETSIEEYIPRGTAVIIAPWNFPLAILCGMTVAALVTGNCAILKPSHQSCVVAARFMDLLREAGFPPGVVQFLPGSGAEVGDYLVHHPQVELIAFTGSREVGLRIYEAAGKTLPGQLHLKKVICEMGGKNAFIIDSDADLDEAIPAVIASAFGYQGQKCSALSRLIVLRDRYDLVLSRLIEACRSLKIGLPEDPGTIIGPVIDKAARDRILQYIEIGKREATLAFQAPLPPLEGFFVPPTIFTNVHPKARIAQEEIFGPVLSVLKVDSLDEAIRVANDSQYALTGGFASRSPANIRRVRTELEAGNIYINRGITGALVQRHPFGGFKMSGGGTKAGGPDYLLNFMFPRVITENHVRRGFAPGETGAPIEGE